MTDDLKTLANWAKELGLSEKKLKEAVKALGLEPDAKRGACSLYGRGAVDQARSTLG